MLITAHFVVMVVVVMLIVMVMMMFVIVGLAITLCEKASPRRLFFMGCGKNGSQGKEEQRFHDETG